MASASEPLRALFFEEMGPFREKRYPGSFTLREAEGTGEWTLWYVCPCGCGEFSAICVGAGFKPPFTPSWNWNVSRTEPTLAPSVNMQAP